MAVGGSALHWGGVTNRFSEEDLTLKSRYGLAVDWPLTWADLERHYCEAERRLGVSGEPGPLPEDKRSEPYPMAPMPLSYNLEVLKAWAEKSGIPFQGTPQAKNTRPYGGRVAVHALQHLRDLPDRRALFAGLHLQAAARGEEDRRCTIGRWSGAWRETADGKRIVVARRRCARQRRGDRVPGEDVRARLRLRLVAAPAARCRASANSSGLVGKYMTGHAFIGAQIELDATLYPGMNEQHSLISRQFFRCAPGDPLRAARPARVGELRPAAIPG